MTHNSPTCSFSPPVLHGTYQSTGTCHRFTNASALAQGLLRRKRCHLTKTI